MAFLHGKATAVLGDQVALTGYLNQTQISKKVQTVHVTTYGNDDKEFIAGLGEGTVAFQGLFDAGANASDVTFYNEAQAAAGMVVSVGHGGLTIGNRVTMCQAREGSYNIQSPVNDAVRLSASFTCDSGINNGFSLHDLEAETGTGDYAGVDDLGTPGTTAFGGVGHIHVTAWTGTDMTVKIQDSSDGAGWGDLLTFTQVTGTTQERKTVSGTIERHLRAQISAATITSATFAVCFARNYV
jgi:hypothetical protein